MTLKFTPWQRKFGNFNPKLAKIKDRNMNVARNRGVIKIAHFNVYSRLTCCYGNQVAVFEQKIESSSAM